MPLKPLEDPIDDEMLARVTESVITGRCPDGTYRRILTDNTGRLVVAGGEGGGGGDVTVLNWPSSQPVTGIFWQATQPVSGTFWQTTQPVSGTFWQATQPVSLAAPVAVTGTFWQGTQPVSGPLTDTQLRAVAVPVSGTFWQATQPVSLASPVAVTGTFWQATQPVSGPLTDAQLRAAAVPVSGTFFQATQPVSAAALPLPSGAATEATLAKVGLPSALTVTATGASGAAVTLTLPQVSGQFHYVTHVRVQAYAAAARTGSATPTLVTTTNLPGSPVYTFETAQAIGTSVERVTELGGNPLKSSVVNTNTTIACPATTGVIWRVTAHYYAAT